MHSVQWCTHCAARQAGSCSSPVAQCWHRCQVPMEQSAQAVGPLRLLQSSRGRHHRSSSSGRHQRGCLHNGQGCDCHRSDSNCRRCPHSGRHHVTRGGHRQDPRPRSLIYTARCRHLAQTPHSSGSCAHCARAVSAVVLPCVATIWHACRMTAASTRWPAQGTSTLYGAALHPSLSRPARVHLCASVYVLARHALLVSDCLNAFPVSSAPCGS